MLEVGRNRRIMQSRFYRTHCSSSLHCHEPCLQHARRVGGLSVTSQPLTLPRHCKPLSYTSTTCVISLGVASAGCCRRGWNSQGLFASPRLCVVLLKACAARPCQTTLKHLSILEKRSQSQKVTHPMNSSSRKPHGVAASGDMRFWMRRTVTPNLQGMPQPPKRSARLPSALQRLPQRQQRGELMRMCCPEGIGPAPHLPECQPTALDHLQL